MGSVASGLADLPAHSAAEQPGVNKKGFPGGSLQSERMGSLCVAGLQ